MLTKMTERRPKEMDKLFRQVSVKDNECEIWRPIPDFEQYYEVSNKGSIRSVDRHVVDARGSIKSFRGKILKSAKNNYGYLNVCLKIRGKNISKSVLVHRMVAMVFLPNPNHKDTVNHKDFDKTNNEVKNLEWCTHQENMDHMFKGKAPKRYKRGENYFARPVSQFDINGNHIRDYDCIADATDHGFSSSHITRVCKGQRNTHKGFIWKYTNTHYILNTLKGEKRNA
jgi:DNA-binding protein